MFKRLYMLRDEEGDDGSGTGTSGDDLDSQDTDDVSGQEDRETGSETDNEDLQEEEEEEEEVIELPEQLAHLQQFAELSPEQVQALVNNNMMYARLSQDPKFKKFAFEAAQRLAGIDVPDESDSDSKVDKDDDLGDLSELSDVEVLNRYIENKVETLLAKRLESYQRNLDPILKDYSERKVAALKKEYSNLDELLPRIESYRKSNPAAANLPIEDIIKIVDYDNAGTRKVDNARKKGKKTKIVTKPRGGTPNGKSKYTDEDFKKMTTAQILEIAAQEVGENLPDY